eukprot:1470860-Pyramimonas_sp.AAC.1
MYTLILQTAKLDGPQQIAEVAASVLGRCCETKEHQRVLTREGIVPRLLYLINLPSPKSQEAGLDLLASLTSDNEGISLALL